MIKEPCNNGSLDFFEMLNNSALVENPKRIYGPTTVTRKKSAFSIPAGQAHQKGKVREKINKVQQQRCQRKNLSEYENRLLLICLP